MSDDQPDQLSNSDDLWSQVDWRAGRLSVRTRRRVGMAAFSLVGIAAVIGCLAYSGVVIPRISTVDYGWGSSLRIGGPATYRLPVPSKKFYTYVTLTNHSWYSVDIREVGADIPGLRRDGVTYADVGPASSGYMAYGQWPVPDHLTIKPGTSIDLQLHYVVTDCAAVPSVPQPIPVKVARLWGEQTVEIRLPPLHPVDGGYSVTTSADPYRIEWQRFLADDVCGTRHEAPSSSRTMWGSTP